MNINSIALIHLIYFVTDKYDRVRHPVVIMGRKPILRKCAAPLLPSSHPSPTAALPLVQHSKQGSQAKKSSPHAVTLRQSGWRPKKTASSLGGVTFHWLLSLPPRRERDENYLSSARPTDPTLPILIGTLTMQHVAYLSSIPDSK